MTGPDEPVRHPPDHGPPSPSPDPSPASAPEPRSAREAEPGLPEPPPEGADPGALTPPGELAGSAPAAVSWETEPAAALPADPEAGASARPPGPDDARLHVAAPRRGRRPARIVRDYVETVLVAILIVLFVTTFMVQNSVIPSASMEDTLLVGDYILVNRIAFAPADAGAPSSLVGMRSVRHDDVVVFKHPDDPDTDYIKRVVGMPGDVIEVRNKLLLRNGIPVTEPWAVHRTAIVMSPGSPDAARDQFGPVRIPQDSLFVMGDNRDYSRDSREFGFIPRSHVTGRAFIVFWSREAAPGAYRKREPGLRKIVASLRTFHRDVRWGRIFTLVE